MFMMQIKVAFLEFCAQDTDSAITEHLHTTVHTKLERGLVNLFVLGVSSDFFLISVTSRVLWVSLPLLGRFVNFRENRYPTASNSNFIIIFETIHKQYCGVAKHLAPSL